MAKKPQENFKTTPQNYPRIEDKHSKYYGCLDDAQLVQHQIKIPLEQVKAFIRTAIEDANRKSSRAVMSIDADDNPEKVARKYIREGRNLLKYFVQYCVDPAATAYDIQGKHYTVVANDLFRRRTLQKERMNAGWRYQYLTLYCARETRRFGSVSDIGAVEADFNAIVDYVDRGKGHLNLFVSVKNRRNTVGGQDFPKAARALESMASRDKNRRGAYLCVFGIAMDRGTRVIRRDQLGQPHSANTEIWLSDYF